MKICLYLALRLERERDRNDRMSRCRKTGESSPYHADQKKSPYHRIKKKVLTTQDSLSLSPPKTKGLVLNTGCELTELASDAGREWAGKLRVIWGMWRGGWAYRERMKERRRVENAGRETNCWRRSVGFFFFNTQIEILKILGPVSLF